jgi:hypothetical protein
MSIRALAGRLPDLDGQANRSFLDFSGAAKPGLAVCGPGSIDDKRSINKHERVHMHIAESNARAEIVSPKSKASFLNRARQLHLYLGTFFAPSILFFSFTGSIQLLGVHQARPGGYQPPVWVAKLAEIHKHQSLAAPPNRSPMMAREKPPFEPERTLGPGAPPAGMKPNLALKGFFLLMSIGLFVTTCLGIYMSFKYSRRRSMVWGLLIAGIAIPGLLLMI